jgi:uncharacterized protein YndB with AHSA1/START domain
MREATLIDEGGKPVLSFERFLPKPVEEVWRAVTDTTEMRSWFPTRIDLDEWRVGAEFQHHFEGGSFGPLAGVVLEWDPPHRVSFTWGEDTITFTLSAATGGTTFILTEELGRGIAARNAAGWEVCLDRLVDGDPGEDWKPRFDRYVKEYEPVLGPQEGPPAGHATT